MLVHNNILIWIYTISITLIISIFLLIILKKKIYKFSYSKKETKEKQQILNNLIFAQNKDINNYLIKFFDNFEIKKHKNFFVLCDKDNKKFIVFQKFCLNELTDADIVEYIKTSEKENIKNVYIFCAYFNKNCSGFCKNIKEFKVKIVDFNNFYASFIKKQNIKPDFKEKYEEKTKYSFSELLGMAFNKNKTKQYFFTGLIFLIGSIFLRYNIYYLIFTSIMFIFCLFSYFNKIYNKKTDDPFKN